VCIPILDCTVSHEIRGTMLGLPAACVPAGMADGSPVAVQAMADRFREDVALDVAAIIEASGIGPKTPIDPAW
jgi:amidase